MNTAVKRTALVIRDLLAYNEQLIRVGRQNFERVQFETDYIVVDNLGAMQRIASGQTFDDVAENMVYDALLSGRVTVDFYGSNAYATATTLGLLMNSQAALELKDLYAITLYQSAGLTDVKALTGQQYGERVQIEFTATISVKEVVNTLRIDTAQIEIRTKDGIQYAN
ncbi:MAG: hypothetical protein JKY80_02150 [Mariprofundaceae bacterium]|nr:hypothetical protein [Methylophaga sp.]MBL4759642.1 hypothetical protein [Mariprofundaceae bacterium]